jgi:hypothetical protein
MRINIASWLRIGGLVLFAILGSSAAAWAQGTPEQRAACTSDAMRLCSSAIPDIGRVTSCMKANAASLSPRCRAAMNDAGGAPSSTQVAKAQTPAVHTPVVQARVHGQHVVASHASRKVRMAASRHHHRGGSDARIGQAMAMAGQIMAAFSAQGMGNMGGTDLASFQRYIPAGLMDSFGRW